MCVFVSRPMITFLRKNRQTAKRVVDFPRERDTFRNKIMEIVEDSACESNVFHVSFFFRHFSSFVFYHFLSFSFIFFHFLPFSFIFPFSHFFIFFQFFLFKFFFHFFCFFLIFFHFSSFSFIFFHLLFLCWVVKICFFFGPQFRTISLKINGW